MPSSHPGPAIGIDFGTTNSSIALAHAEGLIDLVSFPTQNNPTQSFRSILYLEQAKQAARLQTLSFTGPAAIERYLAADSSETPHRLIQSLKSYLTARSLTGTEVFGRRYSLEDLISRIATDLRLAAERHLGTDVRTATIGRPVRFVGAEGPEDDAFAEDRLRSAFLQAGFEHVRFELEPLAAAYAYEAELTATQAPDELILIGDFGGGTSDFSLLHVGPTWKQRRLDLASHDRDGSSPREDSGTKTGLLGNAGLGLAGDSFDARIVRRLVSPALGADSYERSSGNGINGPKLIPAVPAWIYRNLERWHYLSFLKTRNVTEILRAARARAVEPDRIAALITLIDEDLGYQLHQAVQRLKVELSHVHHATFRFTDGSMNIAVEVSRDDFERWIADDLQAIEQTVDGLLESCGTRPDQVDRVFLTGGSSFVPAVRRIFESRFSDTPLSGPRVRAGNEFTSVARGLALGARER